MINPGIRDVVRWLNEHHFTTCDSGDGKTHDFACDRPRPYVVIQLDPDRLEADPQILVNEANRLQDELELEGVEIQGLSDPRDADAAETISIQANYSPVDNFGFIDLTGLDDKKFHAARSTQLAQAVQLPLPLPEVHPRAVASRVFVMGQDVSDHVLSVSTAPLRTE